MSTLPGFLWWCLGVTVLGVMFAAAAAHPAAFRAGFRRGFSWGCVIGAVIVVAWIAAHP